MIKNCCVYLRCVFFNLLISTLDFDECLNGTHRCDYNCSNTIGSYDCSCPNGYDLAPNGRKCNG